MVQSIKIIIILFCAAFLSQTMAAPKTVNVQQAVGSLLLIMPDVKVDLKIARQLSLGLMASYLGTQGFSGYSIGVRLNYLLGKFGIMDGDGWYINPYYLHHDYKVNREMKIGPFEYLSAKELSEFGTLVGHQWMWKNGFNTRLAFGFKRMDKEVYILFNDEKSRYLPNAQFTLGVAF